MYSLNESQIWFKSGAPNDQKLGALRMDVFKLLSLNAGPLASDVPGTKEGSFKQWKESSHRKTERCHGKK